MNGTMLEATPIIHELGTEFLPRTVLWYPRLESTMDIAHNYLRSAKESDVPVLVLADEQSAGRGRLGRSWHAPAGSAVLMSLGMRPSWLDPARAMALVWLVGVALCEGVSEATGLHPRLKWPNDLLLPLTSTDQARAQSGWAKAGGILLEVNIAGARLEGAVLGCGVNVDDAPSPDMGLIYPATHLAAAAGRPVDRIQVLRAILRRLDYWYARLLRGDERDLFSTWRTLLLTLGQEVTVNLGDRQIEGRAEAVDNSGALLVRDATGWIHVINSGDIGLTTHHAVA